jgi:hypothetical protein
MTKIGLLSAVLLFCLVACKREDTPLIKNNSNTANASLADEITYGTDWSGTVSVVIVRKEFTGVNPQTYVSVPEDYVVIGGGVEAAPEFELPGALVTASNPMPDNITWHAAIKDPTGKPHRLVAYAVGLKLPGYTRQTLISEMHIFSDTSAIAPHPFDSVGVYSVDYTLIGGGAQILDAGGNGNYLVASKPVGTAWYGSGKDQNVSSPGSVAVYALGIKTTVLELGKWEVVQEFAGTSTSGGFGVAALNVGGTWVAGCPGGEATYAGNGRLLNTIRPAIKGVTVVSQDYGGADSGTTLAYAVKMRRKM